MATYAIGHKIPDSDSIVGAHSLAYLKSQLGEEVKPARLGDISPESQFILDKFNMPAPELKTEYAGDQLYIIDYSDLAQGPDDVAKATILGIVDHHKLGDMTTSAPLECWIRPVGCSNTIVKEMYDHHQIEIPQNIAGMMLCAILSDTVMFKSPTCTDIDKKAVEELAAIAGIADYETLAMEMFKAKSAIDGTPIRDLVKRDFKQFDMSGNQVGIGQLEVIDISVFDAIKNELAEDIASLKQENNLNTIILLLTDIMKEGSELLVLSDEMTKVETAFKINIESGSNAWLPGVLSRKKQVVPFLEEAFKA